MLMANQENRFFTEEEYLTEIGLDVNENVLERIYADDIKPSDKLKIEFVFVTDTRDKADRLVSKIITEYPIYSNIEVEKSDDYWEIYGATNEIVMALSDINNWNQALWDLGYQVDCKLDGWQVNASN